MVRDGGMAGSCPVVVQNDLLQALAKQAEAHKPEAVMSVGENSPCCLFAALRSLHLLTSGLGEYLFCPQKGYISANNSAFPCSECPEHSC